MSFEIIATPRFQKEFKKLLKKFPSLHSDILTLSTTLLANPTAGNEVFKNCYKLRFAIKSKGKAKVVEEGWLPTFAPHTYDLKTRMDYDR